jgi:3',5'-cyclic-AMP phosphodiesterase
MPPFLKIVHLTDLHLTDRQDTILGIDPRERLDTVITSIKRHHADAACCVVTGDIADAAAPEAYRFAQERLSELPIPVVMTLGNHDLRAPFRQAFADAAATEGGFVQSMIDLGSVAAVLVDTLDEAQAGQGLVCGERLAWLDRVLSALAPKPVIIFMHHPPLSIGLAWFEPMLVANGEEVMALISRHRHVVHVAFGHVHVNVSGVWRGVSFSGSRGTCHKILAQPSLNQADYVDQGAAYDLLLVARDAVSVHTIEPAGSNLLIGREFPTPDGKGEFINLRDRPTPHWM